MMNICGFVYLRLLVLDLTVLKCPHISRFFVGTLVFWKSFTDKLKTHVLTTFMSFQLYIIY